MKNAEPEIDWSLSDEAETEFVLEDDETFAHGAIVGDPLDDAPIPAFEIEADASLAIPQDDAFLTLAPENLAVANDADDVVNLEQSRSTEQPVPRITIHACCDRPEIARMLEHVAADRRLARAEVTVEPGGIDAALARFSAQASPNLLILDTLTQGPVMLRDLDRLAQFMEEGSKVVIIGAINDIALFRELMARGVSEYIVPPIQPIDLIRSICGLYVNPEKPFAGRVISVIGARGGVGASTIAHNIAWSIAERQEVGATLLDLDISFGTAALDFNQDPPQSIADALATPDRVDDVFLERVTTKHTQRLMMLTAPARLDDEFDPDPSAFETIVERVRRTSPFVVLDLPHVWSVWLKQTLLACDDVVIVASPDLASLRNAKNIIDMMKASRPYDAPPTVVLNMVGVPKRPEIPFKDFAEALGAAPIATFAFDPGLFGMASNNGQMIGEIAPAGKIAIEIDTLAASLTGRKAPEVKKSALISRIPFLGR